MLNPPLLVCRIVQITSRAFASGRGIALGTAATGKRCGRRQTFARRLAIIALCCVQVLVLSLVLLARGADTFGRNPDSTDGTPILPGLEELTEEDGDESDQWLDGIVPVAKGALPRGSAAIDFSAITPIRAWDDGGIAWSRPPPAADRCARREA